jgi:hypothetical protein
MKVFQVEFTMFSGVLWKRASYKITALTREELVVAIKDVVQWVHEPNMTPEKKLTQVDNLIIETELIFPTIEEKPF